MSPSLRGGSVGLVALLLPACGGAGERAPPIFLDGAVLVAASSGIPGGREVGQGRRLLPREPGMSAPTHPACVPLFSVPLSDVSAWIAMGGEPPDTALAFDPTAEWLAIGTWRGELRVVNAWTGRERSRVRLAETMVKRVAWSADGAVLYAAEQSTEARLLALDPDSLEIHAQLALSDHVESSAPPAGDDLYGVYTLPGAYALEVLADGDLLVVATHGWNGPDGVRRNRARVLRLSPELALRSAWPADGPVDAVILSAAVGAGRVAVGLSRSASGPAPEGVPIDGVQLLDLDRLRPIDGVVFPPLAPWFDRSFVWEALAVGPDGSVSVGLGDGRLVHWRPGGAVDVHPLGTPVDLGEVAVVSSVGHLAGARGGIFALTAGTNIPFGSAHPDLRPPQPHANENALFALRHGSEGWASAWTWRGPHGLEGLSLSPDGGWLVVGAGTRASDVRTDLFGALRFRPERGVDPVTCPTEGPVFFRHAVSDDGRIAVAEHPYRVGDGVRGHYRVTVLR